MRSRTSFGRLPKRSWMLVLLCMGYLAPPVPAAAPFVPARHAHCVAYSPDGRVAAVGISGQSDETFPPHPHPSPRRCGVVQWYDVGRGERMHRRETFGDLTKVAFSRDGQLIAASRLYRTAAGVPLNEVRAWRVGDGATVLVLDRCHAFDFSPAADELTVVSRRRCVVYDLATGEKTRQIPELAGCTSIEQSPDGAYLAGIVRAEDGWSVCLCDAASGAVVAQSSPFETPFFNLAFAPRSERLVTGHPGNLLLWQVPDLQPIARFRTGTSGLAFPFVSADGTTLGGADLYTSNVVFWDLQTGDLLNRYAFEEGTFHTFHARQDGEARPERAPHRFTFSPDGQAFLAGPHGGTVRLVATGQEIQRFGD